MWDISTFRVRFALCASIPFDTFVQWGKISHCRQRKLTSPIVCNLPRHLHFWHNLSKHKSYQYRKISCRVQFPLQKSRWRKNIKHEMETACTQSFIKCIIIPLFLTYHTTIKYRLHTKLDIYKSTIRSPGHANVPIIRTLFSIKITPLAYKKITATAQLAYEKKVLCHLDTTVHISK